MFSLRSSLRAVVATSAVLLGVAVIAEEKHALIGKDAPEIKADGWLNSKGVTLKDLKGKVAVVEFWATWCPPCRKSIPHLAELHKKHKGDGLVIIGLSDEPKDKVEEFSKKIDMPYVVGYGSSSGDQTTGEWLHGPSLNVQS